MKFENRMKITYILKNGEEKELDLVNEPAHSLYKHHQDLLAQLDVKSIKYYTKEINPILTVQELNKLTFKQVQKILK